MGLIKLNKNGDTIVEVLIAMVILAFVLTGAYQSAQYSLNNIINSENRVTALNIASGQIESLKQLLATNPTSINPLGGNFYLDNSNGYKQTSSLQTKGVFMYDFEAPIPPNPPTTYNYTFTVNVYWRNLNSNPVNHACNSGSLSNCDKLSVSYQAAI
ncbi:MAG TPA: prepilin-type N-terminal cleavage/methylation domain-containing protein [Candidatus Dormibacteraeota bacterium]|nr:prepilin-type N-terminal cleavage/methylation domain-containing protein [Candidatus Dormibacteraeota bacterium]